MEKIGLGQKIWAFLVFFLFKRIRRFLFDSNSDSASERLQKSLEICLKIFDFFSIRKFGIVDKGSDCDAKGPGFESRHRRSFKVSRLHKRRNCPFFSRAYKSLNFKISTIFFLLNFITIWYLKNEHHLKLIDFLVNYTNVRISFCQN